MGRFAKILTLLLLLIAMVFSVSAVSADNIDSYGTVSRSGDCQVTMTVLLNLESVQEEMTFPVPREATTVTVNGRRAKASYDVKENDVIEITFGERTMRIRVLDVREHVAQADAAALYEVLD